MSVFFAVPFSIISQFSSVLRLLIATVQKLGRTSNILPPFEDVLSQVDYCIVNNIPLSKKYSVDELRSLRKDLIYILGRAIQHETNHQTDHALVGTFFNNLDQHTDTIISLNYDLIIDNGFRDFFGFVNYGVTMRNSVHFRPQYPPKLTLYKLHGSLN